MTIQPPEYPVSPFVPMRRPGAVIPGYASLSSEQRKEFNDLRWYRGLRYGILDSMRLTRSQLMKPGEWNDPGIPEPAWLNRALLGCSTSQMNYDAVDYARWQFALRWTLKRERKEREKAMTMREAA